MQPPIDLTGSFRREMQRRQRKHIKRSLLDLVAWLGAFLLGLVVMVSLGVFLATISPPTALIFAAFILIVTWGAWGCYRLFLKS